MKVLLSLLGAAAGLALLIGSGAMNWQFGFALGKSTVDGTVYGGISVASDLLKALVPFFIVYAWRQKHVIQFMAGLAVLVITLGYSFTSSIGYSASNRGAVAKNETAYTTVYNHNRLSLQADTKRLNQVRQDLATLAATEKRRKYLRASERKQRASLQKEQLQLRSDIKQYKKDLGFGVTEINQANSVSSQQQIFGDLTSLSEDHVRLGLIILLSLVLEIGSTLGLYVSLNHLRASPKTRIKASEVTPEPLSEVTPGGSGGNTLEVIPEQPQEVEVTPRRLGARFVEQDNVIHLERLEKPQKKKKKANTFQSNQDLVAEFLEGCEGEQFKPSEGWGMFKEQYPHKLKENQFYAAMKALANKNMVRRKKVAGATVYEVLKAA